MEITKILFSIFSLTLLVISTLLHPSLSKVCNPNDKKVLLQIKHAFNDPYTLISWKPDTDCCTDWYSVTCDDKTHRINSLTVFSGSISGQIPPQVGDLPYLETLELHKQPELVGPIPQAITKLKKLKYLRLTWNNLSGPVPDFLGHLNNLVSLELSFNNLSGQIPASLSKLPLLNSLQLDRNKLTGPIPDSFGEFRGDYFYLVLSHNQLSGKLPASLGKKDFNYIDVSRNKLEGDASPLFGVNKTARVVDLSRNLLEFDLSKVEFRRAWCRWI
ncbi:hypothetical protein TIFTF001_033388 [Ficus carica]|uniref:Leucine-rich repeat-containing N-terminal plant-type domain-containing protein n=1 Tax=Ficus carica TaxID=3494 RepID=A0AA88E0F5_FICCA|nr:hypothetical protein TIFTF001_033388 [Ficus carica]